LTGTNRPRAYHTNIGGHAAAGIELSRPLRTSQRTNVHYALPREQTPPAGPGRAGLVACVTTVKHPPLRGWYIERHGGHSGGETPGSIPNPEAKPSSADGTAHARGRESRTPPGINPHVRGRPQPAPHVISGPLTLFADCYLRTSGSLRVIAFEGQPRHSQLADRGGGQPADRVVLTRFRLLTRTDVGSRGASAAGERRQRSPGTTRQGSPGTTRQGSPGTTRQGSPGTTRQGSPGTTRQGSSNTAGESRRIMQYPLRRKIIDCILAAQQR
jgi:hypothetical protein